MATYYYNLADINRLLGDYNRSECYFKKVFEIRDEYLAQDDYTRGFDYLAYGMLLDSLGMYERAEGYFHRAIKIIQQKYGFHHLVTARFLKSTGDHFQLSADPRKALNYYQQSINAMDPDYDVAGLGANPPLGRINDNLFYLGLLKNKAQVLNDLAETTRGLSPPDVCLAPAHRPSCGRRDRLTRAGVCPSRQSVGQPKGFE